jgi:nitrite reductase (NO-forming)
MYGMRFRLAAGTALATAVVLGALAVNAISASTVKKVTAPTKITVSAGEFYFTLSKKSIPKPGTVVFTVINKGQIAHDFSVQALHKTTKLLQPGQKVTLTVTFKKKGSFYYLCTVPRHAQQGMAGSFIVK